MTGPAILFIISVILNLACFFIHLDAQYGPNNANNIEIMRKADNWLLVSFILMFICFVWYLFTL